MQKKISSLLLTTSLFLFGCQSSEIRTTQVSRGEVGAPMRIARSYWPGQFWVDVAEEKGWFAEAGLNAEIIDVNSDYNGSLRDVAEGTLDTQNFYLFDLVQYRLNDHDLVLAIAADRSSGSDGIVARKEIDTSQKLKGKKVGLIRNSNSEYILTAFLHNEGLKVQDVSIVEASPEDAPRMLEKGQIDAFVSFEPYLSQSVAQGNIRLFDTADLPGVTMAGYTFRRAFINDRPQDVQTFVNVWHRTTEYIKEYPEEAYDIVGKLYGVTQEEVKEFAKLDTALDLRGNIAAFSYSAGFDTMHGSIRQMTNYFEEKGFDAALMDSSVFIDPRFIHVLRDTLIQ